MLKEYIGPALFFGIAILMGISLLVIARFLAPRRPNTAKNLSYECGFDPSSDARMRFDLKYYLLAILFIIFDLELSFILPWALNLRALSLRACLGMLVFFIVLILGFIYEWKEGALEWN